MFTACEMSHIFWRGVSHWQFYSRPSCYSSPGQKWKDLIKQAWEVSSKHPVVVLTHAHLIPSDSIHRHSVNCAAIPLGLHTCLSFYWQRACLPILQGYQSIHRILFDSCGNCAFLVIRRYIALDFPSIGKN